MSNSRVPGYDPKAFPPFAVTADVVLFTIADGALRVLLIQRADEPFRGAWALPGGFVLPDENLDQAAARELAEETGLKEADCHLEQFASYGDPDRDPRMRVVTVAYWAVCAQLPETRAGGDAAAAESMPVDRIESGEIDLAFDHERILRDALEWLRTKMETTTIGARFLPPTFRIADLRRVYEVVWHTTLDPGNFQRGFQLSGAFRRHRNRPVASRTGRGRPATLWHLKEPPNPSPMALQRPIARRPYSGGSVSGTE